MALAAVVLVEMVVGYYLNTGYRAPPEAAREWIEHVRSDPVKSVFQNLHYWASAWIIGHAFLHVAFLLLSGAYARTARAPWMGALLIFASGFALQVTGNLLPFDRHDVQTAVIEGSVASRVPVAGESAAAFMLAGDRFGQQTLEAWHRYHLWLLVPIGLGALLCLFGWGKERVKARAASVVMGLLPLLAVGALSVLVSSPSGESATVSDYAAFDARPSWYTWPLHGALNMFNALSEGLGWLGTVLLPGLLGLLLLLAPWVGEKRDKLVRTLFVLLLLPFGLAAAFYGGSPAPVTGEQDLPGDAGTRASSSIPIDDQKAAAGQELASSFCTPCHGEKLTGTVAAPSLMDVYKRHADAGWYIGFLKDPGNYKPGTTMPSFKNRLSEDQLAQLAEFLRKPKP
jgi:quinol-cytochrome oxidoreductase complex cytochrome b subunit/cytochrome c2